MHPTLLADISQHVFHLLLVTGHCEISFVAARLQDLQSFGESDDSLFNAVELSCYRIDSLVHPAKFSNLFPLRLEFLPEAVDVLANLEKDTLVEVNMGLVFGLRNTLSFADTVDRRVDCFEEPPGVILVGGGCIALTLHTVETHGDASHRFQDFEDRGVGWLVVDRGLGDIALFVQVRRDGRGPWTVWRGVRVVDERRIVVILFGGLGGHPLHSFVD